jgi:hypothetical protein
MNPTASVENLATGAPDLVFTVMTYGTSPRRGPSLVRNFVASGGASGSRMDREVKEQPLSVSG